MTKSQIQISNLTKKIDSEHFHIFGNLTLPSASEGLLIQRSIIAGYIPIATVVIAYNQHRSNKFNVAVDGDGNIYAIDVPDYLYGKKCAVVLVKNESF